METIAFYRSKTFWLNFLGILVTVLEATEFTNVIPHAYKSTALPIVALVVFVLNVILRALAGRDFTPVSPLGLVGKRKLVILLPLVLALTATGCALRGGSAATLQRADVGLYLAIAGVDDVEMALYKTKVITPAQHQSLNPKILVALKAGKAANDALLAWPKGEEKPPIGEFRAASEALTQLASAVADFVPEGPARDQLKVKIDYAAALVRGILIGFGG